MDEKVKMPIVEVHVDWTGDTMVGIYVKLKDKLTGDTELCLGKESFPHPFDAFCLAVDLAYKLGAFLFVDGYCYGKLNK